MTIKKISLRAFALVLFSFFSSITFGQEAKKFEGKLSYRSIENHDKNIVDNSCGMAYNGSRSSSYIIKGENVLFTDSCTNIHILFQPQINVVTIYCPNTKKGMAFNYENYRNTYGASFSPKGPSYMGHGMPPSLYRFTTEGNGATMLNHNTEYIKGRIENQTAGTSFDIYNIKEFEVPQTMYIAYLFGIEIKGLISKCVWEQVNNVPNVGEFKTYVSSELKNIEEYIVDDSVFTIPADIHISKTENAIEFVNIYKENHQYLLQNNKYPTQTSDKVVYEIDEEWDF